MDFGSGGLDLAYEVMRGYDALILVDVSRQGGEPGTLYVMEAEQDDVDGEIEDGQVLDPHGMDPQTVLRFVKYVGGWPGRVFVVACEPRDRRGCRPRPERARSAAPSTRAVERRARDGRRSSAMHELSVAGAVVDTAVRHADGRPVAVVSVRVGAPAPGRARLAALLLRDRRARHRSARARGSS